MLFVILFIWFIYERLGNSYEHTWAFKLDATIQGVVAAMLFLILIFLLVKPSIKIADSIAELPAKGAEPGHLRLKIVNYSLFRAYDLNINVYHKKRIHISGPDVKTEVHRHYEGYKSEVSYLQTPIIGIFEMSKTNAAQLRFKTLISSADDKVKNVLESEDSYLEVHISVRHGLSGLEGNYVKRYHNSSCIKRGYYEHGFKSGIES